MDQGEPSVITTLLNRAADGDAGARDELVPLVYDQLCKIAAARMNAERPDHTLQATALVHEAYARMIGPSEPQWESRAQFFAVAAESMRRVLIDHARANNRLKRGGGEKARRLDFSTVADLAGRQDPAEIIALEEALAKLEADHPRVGRVVMLRFYAGLTTQEAAEAIGISPRTVDNDWAYARAWLFQTLSGNADRASPKDD
ncbi:MAG: ECF-type sigma factor [Planctomycetota bacterium]